MVCSKRGPDLIYQLRVILTMQGTRRMESPQLATLYLLQSLLLLGS